MQSTVVEHKDSGASGGIFNSYTIIKVTALPSLTKSSQKRLLYLYYRFVAALVVTVYMN